MNGLIKSVSLVAPMLVASTAWSFQDAYVQSWWILVSTQGAAEQVADLLRRGWQFGQVANAISLDPGSAKDGGYLGVEKCSNYVEPLADAMCSGARGSLIGPVKSQFGWSLHIVGMKADSRDQFTPIRKFNIAEPSAPDISLSCNHGIPGFPNLLIRGNTITGVGQVQNYRAFMTSTDTEIRFITTEGQAVYINRMDGQGALGTTGNDGKVDGKGLVPFRCVPVSSKLF